jgi:hypothetical protein
VVSIQMPRALPFEQVLGVVGCHFRVVLRRALYSCDCVVWLALAVRTRVVIVVTPVVFVIVVVAARVVLALTVNGVVFGIRLVLFVGS